jgi:hypothetical protein
MRVDTDTYVWGVAKIVIERRQRGDTQNTVIRFVDENGEEAQATLALWGIGQMADRTLPAIVIVEGEGEEREERVLVEGGK